MTTRPAIGVTGCFAANFVRANKFGKRWARRHEAEVARRGAPFVDRSLVEGALSDEIVFANFYTQGPEAEAELQRNFKVTVSGRCIITNVGRLVEPLSDATDVGTMFDLALKVREHERTGRLTFENMQKLLEGFPTVRLRINSVTAKGSA